VLNAPLIYLSWDQDMIEALRAMKLHSQIKSIFFPTLSYITLSSITTVLIAPLALATPSQSFTNSPQPSSLPTTSARLQPQKLAQFADTNTERSQLLQQANALYNQGNLKAAEESFRKFLKKYPDHAFGHFQLGNILFAQKQPEEAVKSFREAIRLRSQYAVAYNAIGMVYASQSRWDEATNEYQKALEINPNYAEALANLALVLWQNNKRDNAVSSLEKALAIFKSQNRNDKASQVERILQQIKNSNEPNLS
jgi:tetratricopeptide (TPR) repeat protein